MGYLVLGITVLVALATARDAWRAGGGDANWELRWRALDPDDRARLAAAGLSPTSTAAIVDPEERELAEGFSRHERRRWAYLDLLLLAGLILTAALMLAGLASFSSFGLVIGAYGLLRWPLESFRDRQIKRQIRTEADPTPL